MSRSAGLTVRDLAQEGPWVLYKTWLSSCLNKMSVRIMCCMTYDAEAVNTSDCPADSWEKDCHRMRPPQPALLPKTPGHLQRQTCIQPHFKRSDSCTLHGRHELMDGVG